MRIGIGIDTGGTYTDVVAYDYDTGEVLAKNKTLTTKEDLTRCIESSVDFLNKELLSSAVSISLSTTLATNACVEGRGGRAKLVLLGLPRKMLDRIDLKGKYGIDPGDVLCMDTKGSFDGSVIDEPDWEELLESNRDFFDSAQSIAISEVNSLRNNAQVERCGSEFFSDRLGVPVVSASDLATELNFIERGATALLNARLLPVISKFVTAVGEVLGKRGLNIPVMILRSDGSLMSQEFSRKKPVETILSGPAASVIGGKGISHVEDCMIIDIGGTTTDISIVEGGVPAMTDSIKIGGWKTQVSGVFINTYGLGGDSRVWVDEGKLRIGSKRVVPLCILATYEPQVMESMQMLRYEMRRSVQPLNEFLYLVDEPKDTSALTEPEKMLIELLEDGPMMIGDPRFNPYTLRSERLEDEGVVMRCGITPTDIMHLKGDFDRFDARGSAAALRYFARNLYHVKTDGDIDAVIPEICDRIYDMAKERLYKCIMYSLLEYRFPEIFANGIDTQTKALVARGWNSFVERRAGRNVNTEMLDVLFDANTTLVGIGAPTHVLLPDVARAMGVEYVIPEDAEVANAIGTAIADISAKVVVDVSPKYGAGGLDGFTVHASTGNRFFRNAEEAIAFAIKVARADAEAEARARGALGKLDISTQVEKRKGPTMLGEVLNLGIRVFGYAKGGALA